MDVYSNYYADEFYSKLPALQQLMPSTKLFSEPSRWTLYAKSLNREQSLETALWLVIKDIILQTDDMDFI